jgi:hypothetical protein
VLFLKTIANGGLTADIPTPDMYIRWEGYPSLYDWANCFFPESIQPQVGDLYGSAPDEVGDVPGIVAPGDVNPVYAVTLWEIDNNARPCGSAGFEQVTLPDILQEADGRSDGFARQEVDQEPFIPENMRHTQDLPPALLAQVWDQPNPMAGPNSGNQ